ncbi:fibronectin type III domain-containing protein [Paucibacter sp. DJ2R-2]|uniref:fibronectin type III domain-containing protein n=1 Tax=Paucibacter sp. DJ2R-2 TaxID=2893558 RepID=UPI0021E42ADD|nr:fibronectin type III domain-containing protein [Paucibacter sp. DJ2R-2]MCV2439274.1 fibronectin type III domain-containing protein [Paucibacter sp. DJ2R-2]
MKKTFPVHALAIACSFILIACGGGGTGSNESERATSAGSTSTSAAVSNKAPLAPRLLSVASTSLINLQLSWDAATDDSTAASQMTYEIHSASVDGFTPNGETLVQKVVGATSADVVSPKLPADTVQFVRVVAVDKQGLKAESEPKSIKIEGIRVSPLRAGQGIPTVFTVQGVGLTNDVTFGLENCTATQPPLRQTDTTGTKWQFMCAPTMGGNSALKGTLKSQGVSRAAGFVVTATDTAPTSLDVKRLKFTRERISLARVPINNLSGIAFPPALLLKCSKVEMRRETKSMHVPETTCETSCTKNIFGWCQPNLPSCTTTMVLKEVSFDVPTAYIGDQEFTADVSINMPAAGFNLDEIKSDVNQIISASIRSSLEKHVNSAVTQLKEGVQACAAKAGALAVTRGAIAAYASGGSAAVSAATETFVAAFSPCAKVEVEKAGERLSNFSEALNTMTEGTKKDVEKYFSDKMNEIKPQLEFGSQCGNWHPL